MLWFGSRELQLARLAVALSGGVDSAVAALSLRDEGHQVIGLSLRLGRGPDEGPEAGARVAAQLGIDHQVIDATDRFEREVVRTSAEAYSLGRTPNPCAICNARVKLPMLWRRSRKLGCEALATGHYCRLLPGPDGWRLAEAHDRAKSQAYFLARVDQAPVGPAAVSPWPG